MTEIQPQDVPSPIDLRDMSDAQAWAETANSARPWRAAFFEAMTEAIAPSKRARILELGSGPGFLAEHVLNRRPDVQMVLLDFSSPMHGLARERLRHHSERVQFVQRSFKDPDWFEGLGAFDYVVTNQAVHELRHKRYAEPLHKQVRSILRPGGMYLVSDHYFGEGGMKNEGLYMTVAEQRQSLAAAGFGQVDELLCLGGMVLHGAA